MTNKDQHTWDNLCTPCKITGICATNSIFCKKCKQAFCDDCSKLHKLYCTNHILMPCDFSVSNTGRLNKTASFWTNKEDKGTQKVKNDYVKAMSSVEHDHSSKSYPDEIFCIKHRNVICKKCKFIEHETCEECIPARLASKLLMESGQYLQTISRMKECNNRANEALDVAMTETEYLKSKETQLLKAIQDIKHSVISHIDQLENAVLQPLYVTQGAAVNNMGRTENILSKVRDETKVILDTIRENTKEGIQESSFKSIMDCHSKIILYSHTLDHICNAFGLETVEECRFQPEDSIQSFHENFGSLGSIMTKKFISNVPSILEGQVKTSDATTKMENEFSAVFGYNNDDTVEDDLNQLMKDFSCDEGYTGKWSDPAVHKNGIVSIICLDKDDLLALDRSTCSLLLIDRKGKIASTFALDCMPWAMTRQDETRVLVSVPGENKLYSIAVQFKELVLIKEIKCDVEPSAVASQRSSIYITSYPWSNMAAVHKLTDDGKVTAFIENDCSGNRLFKAPLDICVDRLTEDFFVFDAGVNVIYAFTAEMIQKYQIDIEYMGPSSAMTIDSDGSLYVCGKVLNIVYKIEASKVVGTIIFDEKDGLSRPQAVSTIPGEKSLCILCAKDNAFKILKIK